MAAQKENLLSPWHVHKTRDALDCFKREREEGLRKSENRRMQLQCDILKLQQDKHLRAMRLQWRCQELKEREGRARRRNQQLLQDFQRAQVTLGEMVAHTATMNTIRLEYQRYLEENSPRWHQQLKDHTQAAQKKRMEELLKDFLKRSDEEHVTASFTKECFSPPQENTYWPQRAASVPEESCRANGRPDGFVPPTMPSSSWLTQAHTSHDALCQPSPSVFPQPHPSQVYHQTSPQQGPPPWGAPQTHWSTPLASSEVGSPPGLNAPWAPPSMAGPSGWGLVLGRGAEAVGGMAPNAEGENRRSGGKCLSQELDIKPVRLSSVHGDSSDGSRDSGSGRNHGERRKRRKEGRQPSGSDRKSSSQESAGTSSADSDVILTTSATRGKRVAKGQESSTSSETESRCGGMSIQERRVEKRTQSDLDQSGSHKEKICRTLRVKSQSAAGESSSHLTGDEDPTDQSEGSGKERGQHKEDSVSVSLKSKINLTAAVERVGEKAADVEEDLGETDGDVEHTDEDTSSENEENRLTEEGEDEEESQREEDKEEDERGEDDEGQESDASGEEEGQEQTGSSESESESAAMSRVKEEQETKEFQAEIEDDVKELDEEEEGGGGGVGIDQPQAGEPEETDSDDSIIAPQEHRSIKVQSLSEEEEANSGEEEEGSAGECSVEHSHSDDEDEGEDIERLAAPQVETRKQENELKSLDKTKVIKKDFEESLSEESDKQVKMAEDTDEFDHFYD